MRQVVHKADGVPWDALRAADQRGTRRLCAHLVAVWAAVLAALPDALTPQTVESAGWQAWMTAGVPLLQADLPDLLDDLQSMGATLSTAPDTDDAAQEATRRHHAEQLLRQTQRAIERGLVVTLGLLAAGAIPLVLAKDVLPLNGTQARSLARQYAGLVEDGMPEAVTMRLLRQRAAQLEATREATIAGQLSWDALTTGDQAAWLAAVQTGAVRMDAVRRYWLLGNNPCPAYCQPVPGMNPYGRRLNESFATPLGPRDRPGIHVGCQCWVEVIAA